MAIRKETGSQDLTAAAFSQTFSFRFPVNVVQVFVHASASITETVTITYDAPAGDGSNYDTVLATNALAGGTDYAFRPTGALPLYIPEGGALVVGVTNANTTGTVYVTVFVEDV